MSGGAGGNRTLGLRNANAALSHLSYNPMGFSLQREGRNSTITLWQGEEDSNLTAAEDGSPALPIPWSP